MTKATKVKDTDLALNQALAAVNELLEFAAELQDQSTAFDSITSHIRAVVAANIPAYAQAVANSLTRQEEGT